MGSSRSLKNPSFSNEAPRISVFPKGSTPWRIDWFGAIAFPDRSVRRKQPSVRIHLSRVTDSRFHDDPAVLLSANSTIQPNFQRRVWVSVGTLPLLRIGDVWRDGQLDVRPDYEMEEFTDVQIDRGSTTLIKAGLNLDDGGYLLPLSEHPWHMQCTQSYCLMLNLLGGRRLIVPCMELVRFYFGSSSSLITKLFLPPLVRKSLYDDAVFELSSGHLMLELAGKISGASAADIGRLHLDPVAWRAAAHVGASALKASVAGHEIHPQAFFPFEGKTTLAAAGKWLSFAGEPRSTFLAYNLRCCAHPFPFNSLRYYIKDRNPVSLPQKGGVTTSSAHSMGAGARDARNQPLVEQDSSNNLAPKTKQLRFESRFPDLAPKYIWKSKAISHRNQTVRKGANVPDVETAAVGESGSERRIRPLDLALIGTQDYESHKLPRFLWDTVRQLGFLQSVTVGLLTEGDHDGWTVPLSILSDGDGEMDARLFISDQNGRSRLRRAGVFSFQHDAQTAYLVVIESEPEHRSLYFTTDDESKTILKILKWAVNKYLRRQDSDLPNFDFDLANFIHGIFGLAKS